MIYKAPTSIKNQGVVVMGKLPFNDSLLATDKRRTGRSEPTKRQKNSFPESRGWSNWKRSAILWPVCIAPTTLRLCKQGRAADAGLTPTPSYQLQRVTTTTTATTNVMDYSAAITQLRGHFTKSRYKTCTDQCRRLLTIGVDGATPATWLRNVKSEEQLAWHGPARPVNLCSCCGWPVPRFRLYTNWQTRDTTRVVRDVCK